MSALGGSADIGIVSAQVRLSTRNGHRHDDLFHSTAESDMALSASGMSPEVSLLRAERHGCTGPIGAESEMPPRSPPIPTARRCQTSLSPKARADQDYGQVLSWAHKAHKGRRGAVLRSSIR